MDSVVQKANQIDELFWEYGRKQAVLFEQNNIGYTNALLLLGGCRKMMVWLYSMLVGRKKLVRIEDLVQEEKEQMWEFIKTICVDEHRTKEKMIQMIKAFYVLEYFLNERPD